MKTNFINEKDFLTEMSAQWLGFGNTLSDKLVAAWRIILSSFNNQLAGEKGLHVCDSVCGSGKTLAVEVASSILSRDWSDIGTLVVVRLKDQCVDVSRRINEISERNYGRSIAKPLFSGTWDGVDGNLSNSEIADAQVLVITHSRYLSGISGQRKNVFSSWRGGFRRFRVVDESLDLVERFHLTRGELVCLQNSFTLRKDFYTDFTNQFGNYWKFLDDINRYLAVNITSQQKYENPFYDVVREHRVNGQELYFSRLIPVIENSHPKDYDKKFSSWKDGEFERFQTEAIETLLVLDRVIRRTLYHTIEENSSTYSTGEIILPSQFDSLCVLDATSNVDRVYSLFKENKQCHPYPVDRTVRSFRNCTIHIRPENSGLGLGITKKQSVPRTKQITKWADEVFNPEDRVLFAGHKVIVESILKHLNDNPPTYQFDGCWWNAIDGKNTWKHFNKLVIVSHNYLPMNYGPVTAIGFEDINPDLKDKDSDNIADSSMAVKLIQLIARIQVRKVENHLGDCPVSDVYLLLPSRVDIHPDFEDEMNFRSALDVKGQYLLEEIEKSMNEVCISKWTSFNGFGTKPKTGTTNVHDKFIEWIRAIPVGEVWDREQFDSTVSPAEVKSLKAALASKSSRVTKMLQNYNITKKSSRGRNGRTTFAKQGN